MMMGIVMITMVMMTIQDNHQNDNDDGNRFLPPDGMPSARRAAQDGDRLPCRLRGDARLHRQLCFHLPWLVPHPPPLLHLDEMSSNEPEVAGLTPFYAHCCSKQLYTM